MRILITADLHYDLRRSREPARELARRACAAGGDALVLVGDTAGADLATLRECLDLFAGFRGAKLLVVGNHCLWCADGEDSLRRYEELLPRAAGEAGFVVLDHHPQVLGEVGLVGSVGWYDYSFRDESLGIPVAFYRAKLAPGAASHRGADGLIDAHRAELTPRHYGIGVRWMDGRHVRLPVSDEEFVGVLAEKLRRQIAELSGRVGRIVALIHHLPFAEMVPRDRPDRFAFAAAFMGSARLGRVLTGEPKVTHLYCGHSHWPGRWRIGHIQAVNVGSTYTEKHLETLNL